MPKIRGQYSNRDEITGANGGRRHRIFEIFIGIFAVLFIIIIVALNYVPNETNAEYSPNSYYYGLHVSDSKEDPLDTYAMLAGGKGNTSAYGECKTDWITVEDSKLLTFSGLNLGVESSDSNFNASSVKSYGESFIGTKFSFDDDDPNHWYLWGNSGTDQHIVSPFKSFEFRNSNFSNPTRIDVAAAGNADFIRFENVTNWYCHYDSDTTVKSHTIRVGATGQSSLQGNSNLNSTFTVVGKANVQTYMVGIKVDAAGQETECSPAEIFGVQ